MRTKFYRVLWAPAKAGASDKTLYVREWWLYKPSNQEQEVAVLQPTPMKLSTLFHLQFNSDWPRQHTTAILVVHIVCCLQNWNCIPSLWHLTTLRTLNSSMSRKPVLVTRRSFPPPPHATNVWPTRLDTNHRLTTATLEYSKFILSTSYSVLPRIILECSPPSNYCYSKFGTG